MHQMLRSLSAVAAVAMLATACADAPDSGSSETPTTAATTGATEGDPSEMATDAPSEMADGMRACQVTDTGGVDDRSFNQTAFAGLERAEAELGVEAAVLESTSDADFAPNIAQFVQDDCDIIITVGFLLDGATQAAATENPDQLFAIIDVDFAEFDGEGNYVGDVAFDNARELTFSTDQAAFLAGYIAAATTETGTVATYGGIPIPPVTIFMDGFLAGVRYHNQENGTTVAVLGWDGTDGSFTGNFESQEDGRNLTDQFIANGADIILPVAGPVGLGTIAAAEVANEAGSNVSVIWVDTDGRVSVPDKADIFLTSVQKKMDNAVYDTVAQVASDSFESGVYSGTLANDGVGIPSDTVPAELTETIAGIIAGIIDGSISVSPGDYS